MRICPVPALVASVPFCNAVALSIAPWLGWHHLPAGHVGSREGDNSILDVSTAWRNVRGVGDLSLSHNLCAHVYPTHVFAHLHGAPACCYRHATMACATPTPLVLCTPSKCGHFVHSCHSLAHLCSCVHPHGSDVFPCSFAHVLLHTRAHPAMAIPTPSGCMGSAPPLPAPVTVAVVTNGLKLGRGMGLSIFYIFMYNFISLDGSTCLCLPYAHVC